MSISKQPTPGFSDDTIRRFLLAQLSRAAQSTFETVLFTNAQLEQRVRLAEIALIDDHAAERLSVSERAAFQQNFLVTAARQKKLEVSAALQKRLAKNLVRHSRIGGRACERDRNSQRAADCKKGHSQTVASGRRRYANSSSRTPRDKFIGVAGSP